MKKKLLGTGMALGLSVSMLAGMTVQAADTWTVTCPWAASGVAAMVNQQAAAMSTDYSEDIILVADAVAGDAATVNSWIADNTAGDNSLVFAGEGLFAVTPLLDAAKLQFTYDDFEYVENLYSSIFVLSADASLEINGIEDLQAYVESGETISVATNGATSSEAFLAAALFGSMGASDQLKLVPYESAAEAAQAVSKGETSFAVSHQSQIYEAAQQESVTIVCAFDEDALENGPFAGVEGVGAYGYPYFRNRCFIMAPAGTDEETVETLRTLYDDILADEEMTSWLQDTMYLEVDPMTEEEVLEHIDNVSAIVEEYMDIVVG
ncbi:MAG: hypothetical protein LUH07_12970 [Lachnospiraceae bacterium]|nr:hypothetical protein [Lachnospiraceae bacterium]